MRYAIYTTELIESRKRRMPWRTVLELAKAWGGVVFSGDGAGDAFQIEGVSVYPVDKPFGRAAADCLVRQMLAMGVSRLYYTIGPGRDYAALQDACDAAGIELVWYMTSSWNGVWRCLRAMRCMGIRSTLPFLKQALIPKRAWIRRLNRRKVRPLVVMSEFTAQKMIECGYPADKVHPILPGLDPLPIKKAGKSTLQLQLLTSTHTPYFLFFGPPQAIRGIYLILAAVRRLAKRRKDFLFVPLVRGDENAKEALAKLKAEMERPEYAGVIQPHFESLSPQEINAYIDGSVAVLKPFVLVPSEVPLAPMEAMQRGKLVIGFDGDGTGALIGKYGQAVPHCGTLSLAKKMNECLDLKESSGKCDVQKHLFETWSQVSDVWRKV